MTRKLQFDQHAWVCTGPGMSEAASDPAWQQCTQILHFRFFGQHSSILAPRYQHRLDSIRCRQTACVCVDISLPRWMIWRRPHVPPNRSNILTYCLFSSKSCYVEAGSYPLEAFRSSLRTAPPGSVEPCPKTSNPHPHQVTYRPAYLSLPHTIRPCLWCDGVHFLASRSGRSLSAE
ncbi:hypothetical protein P170DRAFT_150541 [Aspergillus steynii IBT 23096]|uniref:Uncharacterized protein n=1 Tax=Aspergillus steynii IBT 23096 TaxID=1392250 RepID=A0A2I2GCM0_9EURO|nr:uncharacterized protein P170DRAFT_150541 [Aspergillus steynii IBT 23096]PLB50634.1 hypothetical protein P170DRAFT_150541 [Aspergillus steynii IBT 23096]